MEPTINGPFTPDLATPLSKFASFVKENGWSDELSAGLIGSCTNSSYEDMVIQTYPVHRSAVDFLTDTRRELGSTSEGSWSEDAGPEIDNTYREVILTSHPQVPFLCTPGSEQIRATIERDNITELLEETGATVLANACGPCIGQVRTTSLQYLCQLLSPIQWKREDKHGEENGED